MNTKTLKAIELCPEKDRTELIADYIYMKSFRSYVYAIAIIMVIIIIT